MTDPVMCGCRFACGDLDESDDDPGAICRGLAGRNDYSERVPLDSLPLPSSQAPKEAPDASR